MLTDPSFARDGENDRRNERHLLDSRSTLKLQLGDPVSIAKSLDAMLTHLSQVPTFRALLTELSAVHVFRERAERMQLPTSIAMSRAEKAWLAFRAGKCPLLAHFYFSGMERFCLEYNSYLCPDLTFLLPGFRKGSLSFFFAISSRRDGTFARTALSADQVARDRRVWLPVLNELCERARCADSDPLKRMAASFLLRIFRPGLRLPCSVREYVAYGS